VLLQQQQQHPFNGPFSRTTRISWNQKGKTNLHLLQQETVNGNNGISWAICKSASCPRQTTTKAPHHSGVIKQGKFIPWRISGFPRGNWDHRLENQTVRIVILYIVLPEINICTILPQDIFIPRVHKQDKFPSQGIFGFLGNLEY